MLNKFKIFTEPEGGDLIPIEFFDLNFIPKRIFTVSNVPKGEIRGQHAHFKTKQLLICIKGSILVGLDDGKNKTEKIINKGESILVNEMIWDWQKFLTGEDFLLAVCSTNYDKSDYIENIERFYELTK